MNVQTVKPPGTESHGTTGAEHQILPGLKCINCGYDLRGLSKYGNCPECGEPVYASMTYAQYRATRTASNDGTYNPLIIIVAQAVIPLACLAATFVAITAYMVGAHALAMDIHHRLWYIAQPQRYPFLMLPALVISLHMVLWRTRAYKRERSAAVLMASLACWLFCWLMCLALLGSP